MLRSQKIRRSRSSLKQPKPIVFPMLKFLALRLPRHSRFRRYPDRTLDLEMDLSLGCYVLFHNGYLSFLFYTGITMLNSVPHPRVSLLYSTTHIISYCVGYAAANRYACYTHSGDASSTQSPEAYPASPVGAIVIVHCWFPSEFPSPSLLRSYAAAGMPYSSR